MFELLVVVLLVVVSLVATSRYAMRLRRSPAVMGLLSGGWPAVGLGFLLGDGVLGVIPAEALRSTTPLIIVGLGWIGMMLGLQLRRSVLSSVPGRVAALSVIDGFVSFVVWGVVGGVALWWWSDSAGGAGLGGGAVAGILSPVALVVAGSMGWSMETRSQRVTGRTRKGDALAVSLRLSGALSGVLAVVLYGVVVKLPDRGLDGAAVVDVWGGVLAAFMALLLACFTGILGRFALELCGKHPGHQLAVFLGLVSFSAGIASQTGLSPLFASMLTGAVLANVASRAVEGFMRFILNAEQTVAVLFSLLAGLLAWPALGPEGAVLALAMVAGRLALKPALVRAVLAGREVASVGELPVRSSLYLSSVRQSPVAIALGVGLVVLEWSPLHRELLTVILFAGLLSEVLPTVLSAGRRTAVESGSVAVPTGAEGGGRAVVGGGA